MAPKSSNAGFSSSHARAPAQAPNAIKSAMAQAASHREDPVGEAFASASAQSLIERCDWRRLHSQRAAGSEPDIANAIARSRARA